MVVSRSQMTAYADLLGRPCAACTLQECPRYRCLQWDAPQEDPMQPWDRLTQPEHCPLPLSRGQDAPVLEVLVGLLSWEPTRRTPAAAAATARLFPLARQEQIAQCYVEDASMSKQLARPLESEPDEKSEPGMKSELDKGCRCSGQCGRVLCRRRRPQKNLATDERICSREQCPGSLYCCECKCELDTCSPLALVVVNG